MDDLDRDIACTDACELARLLGGIGAFLCWTDHVEETDPLPLFEKVGERRFIWDTDGWVLGIGCAFSQKRSGPGRVHALGSGAADLRLRCVNTGYESAPPTFMTAVPFESRGKPGGSWGPELPGSELVLPAVTYVRTNDVTTRTIAIPVPPGSDPEDIARALDSAMDHLPPPPQELVPESPWPDAPSPVPFPNLVAQAVDLLRYGAMRKVVLARAEDVDLPHGFSLSTVVSRLHRHSGNNAAIYAWDIPEAGCFVGSTPELLLDYDKGSVETVALAGSRPRDNNPQTNRELGQELLASTKERKEHNLVVEHLEKVLIDRAPDLVIPQTPVLRQLTRIQHLETRLHCQVTDSGPFDLLDDLQPTPAVCGLPTPLARAYIRQHEGVQRGLYTGSIGWQRGERTRFWVPLRGGVIGHDKARLFAGAGIVESSNPEAEFTETETKLATMRIALGLV